ncbi:glycosyltransferase family 2 protein [Reichenbachiella sp.]
MEELPLVSVVVITYNHEKHIAKCIKGILVQEIDFQIEIIIGDDCSTDGNQKIIESLVAENNDPKKSFRLLFHPENLSDPRFLPGKLNFVACMKLARGQFIALCDGDDYWIDSNKLKKQVNFLNQHPNYSLCGSKWRIEKNDAIINDELLEKQSEEVELDSSEFLSTYFSPIHTSTVLFRNIFSDIGFSWKEFKYFPVGDIPLFFILSIYGRVYRFNEYMSVYNKGIERSITKSRSLSTICNDLLSMLDFMNDYSELKFKKLILAEQRFIREHVKYEEKKSNRLSVFLFLLRNRIRLSLTIRDVIYLTRHYRE